MISCWGRKRGADGGGVEIWVEIAGRARGIVVGEGGAEVLPEDVEGQVSVGGEVLPDVEVVEREWVGTGGDGGAAGPEIAPRRERESWDIRLLSVWRRVRDVRLELGDAVAGRV